MYSNVFFFQTLFKSNTIVIGRTASFIGPYSYKDANEVKSNTIALTLMGSPDLSATCLARYAASKLEEITLPDKR